MQENHNIEFKINWRDDYLKQICSFANSNGGTMYIGIDDEGNIIGINNSKRLLDEIPNKIKDNLGILADVRLENKDNKDYIIINVNKYLMPIFYNGKYYIRSGSSTHEATRVELNSLIFKQSGIDPDGIIIPNVTIEDISHEAINYFKSKSIKNNRLSEDEANIDDVALLNNLSLIENNSFKLASLLMFGKDPEKYITGSYIKIGFFDKDDILVFQEEVHGPLILQVDETVDLLYKKFMKGLIRYDGLTRVEEYIIGRDSLRELILNAVQHKNYDSHNPIQISVYDDKIYIWNTAIFPEQLDINNMYKKHSSFPYNPNISRVFYKSGYVESWAQGFEKIKKECNRLSIPLPTVESKFGGVWVTCIPSDNYLELLKNVNGPVSGPVNGPVSGPANELLKDILELIIENNKITIDGICSKLNKGRTTIKRYLNELKDKKIIERVGSDKTGYWKINKK